MAPKKNDPKELAKIVIEPPFEKPPSTKVAIQDFPSWVSSRKHVIVLLQ